MTILLDETNVRDTDHDELILRWRASGVQGKESDNMSITNFGGIPLEADIGQGDFALMSVRKHDRRLPRQAEREKGCVVQEMTRFSRRAAFPSFCYCGKRLEVEHGNKYSAHEVAVILANAFGDDCACNFNDNDDSLPMVCDFRDTVCPNPCRVACWEQYLKHNLNQGGGMKKCKTCYLINAKPAMSVQLVSGDDHYKYWPNTQTNADRIRSMNDRNWRSFKEYVIAATTTN